MKTMISPKGVLWTIFALAISLSAHAQWSTDPTVNNAICTATGDQFLPTIVSDGAGGAIITWYDGRGGVTDIYAQRISSSGAVQWTANGVAICTAGGYQRFPIIVSDGAGGAIITWEDGRSGTINTDIYAQRINSSGAVQWTANGVAICTATRNQYSPTIVSDGASGAIITWNDTRSSGAYHDIYAQRISSSGAVLWTGDGVAICTATGDQQVPTIVSDGSGGAIITWEDGRSGIYSDIYAQRISSSGAVQWTADGVAICTAARNQSDPTIVSDGAGGAIITWEDYRSNVYIYAQRINTLGAVQWTGDGVAIGTAAAVAVYVRFPTIVSDGAGGAIITWADIRSSNSDIYAQRINSSGAVQWTANGVVICTAAGTQDSPTIVSDGLAGAIITWYDSRGGISDIYAQRISSSGAVQWTADGVAICTAAGNQFFPTIVSDGAGGAIITWYDYRGGVSPDIYAQQINASGQLGVVTSVENLSSATPQEFHLDQNYPNPFNPTTKIRFTLSSQERDGVRSFVSLKVYDVLGSEVATLVNENLQPGNYQTTFSGEGLASGVYFYRLTSGGQSLTKKLLLTK